VRLGVRPDAVSVAGVLVAVASVVPAASGGRWPVAAAALVAVSGLLDALDGAVAVLAGRTTRWGFVLDSLCDRIADAAYAGALFAAGAPATLAVAGGAVAWLHEYVRARSVAAGLREVGVVTVSERPTRVLVAALFLLGTGLYPTASTSWATAGACALTAVGTVGLVQLLLVVHRRLREP
jgi:phosphatidylglycerophosphate synthase